MPNFTHILNFSSHVLLLDYRSAQGMVDGWDIQSQFTDHMYTTPCSILFRACLRNSHESQCKYQVNDSEANKKHVGAHCSKKKEKKL